MEGIENNIARLKKRAPEKNMHTDLQLATKEVWEYCNKDKPFGFYLGMVKRIGTDRARYIIANMKDSMKPADHPGKLFVYLANKKD